MTIEGYPQLRARFAAISGGVATEALMRTLGIAAVREQKLLVRRKTGNTARTIHLERVTKDSALTVASAKNARWLEEGTRPHEITPKAKKALAWAASPSGRRLSGRPRTATRGGAFGGMIVRRRVHHPGTKAYPFMVPGARKALEGAGLAQAVVERWNGAA